MAVNYTGGTSNQSELERIQQEIYAESYTIRDGLIDIDQNHKNGADVYESSVSVTVGAATTGPVTATGNINMNVK